MGEHDLRVLQGAADNLAYQAQLADEGVDRAKAGVEKAKVNYEQAKAKVQAVEQLARDAHVAAKRAQQDLKTASNGQQQVAPPSGDNPNSAGAGIGAFNATVKVEEG